MSKIWILDDTVFERGDLRICQLYWSEQYTLDFRPTIWCLRIEHLIWRNLLISYLFVEFQRYYNKMEIQYFFNSTDKAIAGKQLIGTSIVHNRKVDFMFIQSHLLWGRSELWWACRKLKFTCPTWYVPSKVNVEPWLHNMLNIEVFDLERSHYVSVVEYNIVSAKAISMCFW